MNSTDRATDDYRKDLIALGAATLGESGAMTLDPRIKPIWRGAAFAGPAFTASCAPGDNLAIHAAVAHAPRGSVLAVSVTDRSVRGYWGEVLTTAAEFAGIAALVIDGEVRDVAALESHGFPVFARGVALRGATKYGPGTIGGQAIIGDVLMRTGDWLVGDADGVVAISTGRLEACHAAAAARAEKESRFFAALRDGVTTVELLSLDLTSITMA
jgi:4-hydroxy-4-methyl-2-oxoglutarate aldolase